MRRLTSIPVLCLLLWGASPVAADDEGSTELIRELEQGGYVIYLRHAMTDATRVDESLDDLADCTQQRPLSEEGRAQARKIGEAIGRLGIPIGAVQASPYCRCIDTAKLAFGRVVAEPDLISSIPLDEEGSAELAAALLRRLSTPPAAGTNTVIVGHMSNLKEATGIYPKPEGAAHVFEPVPGGAPRHLGRIAPDAWRNASLSQ